MHASLSLFREYLQAVIDLSTLLNEALSSPNGVVERNKTFIRTTHNNWPGQARGDIDMQLILMPKSMADAAPVGQGREAPNRDPYLEEPKRESFWSAFFAGGGWIKYVCCLVILLVVVILGVIFLR